MIRKYTLVEDEWLVDDLEDEFKSICGSAMSRIADDDIYFDEAGVGTAYVYSDNKYADNNGPVDSTLIYLLIRRTSEEVLFDEKRYVKSTTKIREYSAYSENKEDQGIEIKSEWYLVEDIVDEQAILDQKLKMMRV